MSVRTLDIRDLYLSFKGYTGTVEVLHGISLHIDRGERVALVGESGSGKSVTARIVLGLLQELRSARISGIRSSTGFEVGAKGMGRMTSESSLSPARSAHNASRASTTPTTLSSKMAR